MRLAAAGGLFPFFKCFHSNGDEVAGLWLHAFERVQVARSSRTCSSCSRTISSVTGGTVRSTVKPPVVFRVIWGRTSIIRSNVSGWPV